jgi:FixJ family two-component response regulator
MMNLIPRAHAAHVLVIDDDLDLLRLLSMRLAAWGFRVSTAASAEEGLARIAVEPPQLVVSDIRLPGQDGLALFDEIRSTRPTLPVILLTAHGTIPDAVQAMSRGVFGYLTKPFDSKVLLAKIEQALQLSPAAAGHETGSGQVWREGIVFRSSRMAELLEEARVVAASDASVLIRGDSGTGKEVLARAIHRASPRAQAPFVAINCGAIPEQCSSRNSSATSAAPSPVPPARTPACSRRLTAARCFSTRSATCRWRCRSSCCACCRSGPCGRSARRVPNRWTCASFPPPTATSKPPWPRARSARICTIASTS